MSVKTAKIATKLIMTDVFYPPIIVLGMVLAASSTFVGMPHRRYKSVPELAGVVFNEDVLFSTTAARSFLECVGKFCLGNECCRSVSYGPASSGNSKECRGYGSHVMALVDSSTPAPGFRSVSVTEGTFPTACRKEVNVAVAKPTSQSSLSSKGYSSRAVDNNTNANWAAGSCTHTWTLPQPAWWQVDLSRLYTIKTVKVTNRADCCSKRLINLDIHVYTSDPESDPLASGVLCHHQVGHLPPGTTALTCSNAPLTGCYVRLTSGVPDESITLCEVQVIALIPAL